MADIYWRGDSVAVAQVDTQTFGGTWDTDDLVKYTIGGKTITVTAGSATIATIISTVVAALNASTIPQFAEITWAAASGTTITGTADTAGKPFTLTVTTTESDNSAADLQTLSNSTTTANSGPNCVGVAANYSGGALPVNGDNLWIVDGSSALKYDLEALSAVTLGELNIEMSFEDADIGLPFYNEDNSLAYVEYRPRHLKVAWTTCNIGRGAGTGNGRTLLHWTGSTGTLNIFNAGAPTEPELGTIQLQGTGTLTAANVYGGTVGLAIKPGESATITTLRQQGGDIFCSATGTLTNVSKSGGTLVVQAATTTFTQRGGQSAVLGSAAHASLVIDSGSLNYMGSGTITTLEVGDQGVVTFANDLRARTVTNCTKAPNGVLLDPFKTVTWTNGVDLVKGGLGSPSLDLGTNMTVTPSAL